MSTTQVYSDHKYLSLIILAKNNDLKWLGFWGFGVSVVYRAVGQAIENVHVKRGFAPSRPVGRYWKAG